MSQYCKFIYKANISYTGILHTEALGRRIRDWHFSFRGTEWHENEGCYVLTSRWWRCCVSVCTHCELLSNLNACWCREWEGGWWCQQCVQRGPLSSQTAPSRLDFQLHDEAFEKHGWLHAPEERGSANLAFMRGGVDQSEGAAPCGGTHQCYAVEGLTMQPTLGWIY